jgi:DNA-binding transcriptional MerR regulator
MAKKPQSHVVEAVSLTTAPPVIGAPTLTVADIAQALMPIAPDVAGTVQRIRHWTRERMLLPIDQHHAGPGKHRLYHADAVYEAAILHTLTVFGLPVAGSRVMTDGLTKARLAISKWKTAQAKGRTWNPVLVVLMANTSRTPGGLGPVLTVGVYQAGEEIKKIEGFHLADTVLTIKLELGKLFAQVSHGRS